MADLDEGLAGARRRAMAQSYTAEVARSRSLALDARDEKTRSRHAALADAAEASAAVDVRTYRSYQELLADGEVEAIVLLTPPAVRGEPTIAAAESGRHVFTQLTVEENIRLGTSIRKDRDQIESDFQSMLKHFPFLAGRLKTPGGKLSGGEQQQLVIARALMTRPRIILLDEPSLGLAPIIVDTVYGILHTLREQGITLLVVEQSTHRALENADRIYVLRRGQIELHGKSGELNDEELERAYFGFDETPAEAPAEVQV